MPQARTQETDRPRVLVLQGEEISTTVLRRMVDGLGFESDTTSDVGHALDLLRGGGLAAAVVELQLPGVAQERLVRDLAAAAGGSVLVGTALDRDEALVAACAAASIRLLAHPVSLVDLEEALAGARSPGSSGSPGAPVVDISVLTGLADQIGDPGLAREIVRTYLAEVPDRRSRLASCLGADPDLDEVQRAAHSFKSASATVGALGLGEACQQVESSLRRGETDGLPALVRTALALLPPVVAELEEWVRAEEAAQEGSNR